tara:strand:+ start:290 stop:511 length:222 start_codon:yes stop_codon:yes gene_type:complete
MKTNVGSYDAGVRFVLGAIVIELSFHGLGWWGLLGFIPLLTACIGFCPFYRLLHLDSKAWEDDYEDHHGHGHA